MAIHGYFNIADDKVADNNIVLQSFSKERFNAHKNQYTHNKQLCVWRLKPEDTEHLKLGGKLSLIEQQHALNTFKLRTVHLDDDGMRKEILRLITNNTDAFKA